MTPFPPMVSPRFRVEGNELQYKPFPAYPTWLVAWDISGLVPSDIEDQIADINAAIEALEAQDASLIATDAAFLDSLSAVATAASNAQADATTAISNAADAQATADEALAAAGGISYPDCAYLVPGMFRTIVTGFTTPVIQANQWTQSYADLNGSGSIADCKILLAAGDYDFSIGYLKGADQGNIALKIDGTGSITSVPSLYNATTQLGQITEGNLITGLSAGLHTIRLEVLGKSPSSSGFHCRISFLAIRKKP